MDLGIKDKVALVTAASRGLGKAAALALAREGARVALCSRGPDGETTARAIADETGAETFALRADVANPEDVARLVQATLDHFGRLDLLVLNAGGPPPGNFFDLTPQDWERAVQGTLMSVVHLCYEALPHLLAQGSGSVVAIESMTIKEPADHLILSNAIRLAVIGLLKSLANEVGPKGIRINTINPAWTWTERVEHLLTHRAAQNGTSVEEEAAQIAQHIPLGRLGTVEEFGKTVAWLLSPAAGFIHGHALLFDGGLVKTPL